MWQGAGQVCDVELQPFGLTRPAFPFSFADPGHQVVANAQQARLLGWVSPEEGSGCPVDQTN